MRRQLQVSIMTLEEELRKLTEGDGSFNLLYKYASGLGTGLKAFQSAKDEIERQLDRARKEIAALHEPSRFEKIKAEYIEDYGNEVAYKESLSAYIDALEKCRPWVIVDREDPGNHWHDTFGIRMFDSPNHAGEYMKECMGSANLWQIVQWEGHQ